MTGNGKQNYITLIFWWCKISNHKLPVVHFVHTDLEIKLQDFHPKIMLNLLTCISLSIPVFIHTFYDFLTMKLGKHLSCLLQVWSVLGNLNELTTCIKLINVLGHSIWHLNSHWSMNSTCGNTVLCPLGFNCHVGNQIRTFSGLEAKFLVSGDRKF